MNWAMDVVSEDLQDIIDQDKDIELQGVKVKKKFYLSFVAAPAGLFLTQFSLTHSKGWHWFVTLTFFILILLWTWLVLALLKTPKRTEDDYRNVGATGSVASNND